MYKYFFGSRRADQTFIDDVLPIPTQIFPVTLTSRVSDLMNPSNVSIDSSHWLESIRNYSSF